MRHARTVALVVALTVMGALGGTSAASGAIGALGLTASTTSRETTPPVGTVGSLTVGGGSATATLTDRAGSPIGPTVSEPQAEFAPTQSDLAAAPVTDDSAVIPVRTAKRTVMAAAGCRDIDAWRYSTSFLFGTLVYKFHQTVHFCWNSANKLTVVNTGTYVSNVDPNWTYRGLTASDGYFFEWCCGAAQSGHYGLREGHFDNCVPKYGCVGSEYPWVKIWVQGDGSWSYDTGE